MNRHFAVKPGENDAGMTIADSRISQIPLQHRERPAGTSLFDLGQLDVRWEASAGTLWTHMTPVDRPNFNPAILRDFPRWQSEIRREFAAPAPPLRSLVLGSRFPGGLDLGGT